MYPRFIRRTIHLLEPIHDHLKGAKICRIHYEREILERIKVLYQQESYQTNDHLNYINNHDSEVSKTSSTAPLPDKYRYDYTRYHRVFEKHSLDKDFCQGEFINFWPEPYQPN